MGVQLTAWEGRWFFTEQWACNGCDVRHTIKRLWV